MLVHDLTGIENVNANQVKLFPYHIPAAPEFNGRDDGIRHTWKQRAAISVDRAWGIHNMPVDREKRSSFLKLLYTCPLPPSPSLVVRSSR